MPRVEELRTKLKLKGKPTPEQLEELRAAKEELKVVEAELAEAEAERDACVVAVIPNPPDPPHPTARPTRTPSRSVGSRSRPPTQSTPRSGVSSSSARRGSRAPASGTSPATPRSSRSRSYPLRPRPCRRARPYADDPAGPRSGEGDVRHRLLPDRALEHLRPRGRRALPHGRLRGRSRRVPHGGDPRGAPAPLLRLLDVLPPRGRGRRQGHERDVPGAPVQQGRALRVYCEPERSGEEHDGCLRSRRRSSRRLGLPYRSSTSPAGDLGDPAVEEVRHRGVGSHQQRYREITSTSNTTDFQARRLGIRYRVGEKRLETPHTLNGTAVTDRWLLAILENFRG